MNCINNVTSLYLKFFEKKNLKYIQFGKRVGFWFYSHPHPKILPSIGLNMLKIVISIGLMTAEILRING